MGRSELPQPPPGDFSGAEIIVQEVARHPRNPVRGSKRWGLVFVFGVGLSLFIACSPDAKAITVSPTNEPAAVTTTAVVCDPEQFAQEMGIPTPYPRGMEGAPENIIAIINRIKNCQDVAEKDKNDVLVFNVKVEAAATAGAATVQAKQPETPPPIQTVEPTPEVKVAPVEIFPKEMDPYIEIVDYLNPKNTRVLIVGIKGLPEDMAEVPVSAPIRGGLRNALNDPNYSEVGDLNDLTLTSFAFKGFKTNPDKKVEPGDKIGVLTDTGSGYREKLWNRKYIATIDVYTKNPLTNKADWEKANEIVKQYFPRAKIVQAEYDSSKTPDTSTPPIKQMLAFEDEKPAGLR